MATATTSAHGFGEDRHGRARDRARSLRSPAWLLVLVLLATVATFTTSLVYSHRAGTRLDARATVIATTAVPAVEHLSAARGQLLHVHLALVSAIERAQDGEPIDRTALDAALGRLHRELGAYSTLPFFAYEPPRYNATLDTVSALEAEVEVVLGLIASGDVDGATDALDEAVAPALARADGALQGLVRINAEEERRLSAEIPKARMHARNVRYALDGVTLVLALIVVALALQIIAQKRSAERRADDTAEFTARLASLATSTLAISDAITRSLGLDDTANEIAKQACSVVRGARCTLRLGREDGSFGVVSTAVCGKVEDADTSTPILRIPIRHDGMTVGEIELARRAGEPPFSDDDARIAELLAAQAGVAIHSARLYNQAHEATRARDDLLATVSHDLRNPLSSIRLAASLVREQVAGTRAVDLVERIDRSAHQMNRLLGDLLDAARIEAGGLVGEPKPERLSPIVDEACELFAIEAGRRSISVSRRIPPVIVLCERDLLIRVLANLLGNALKFTAPGGSISVFADERDHEVEVRVSDTGCGMSAEDLEHVFDRYWQRYHSDRRGSGLGLYIARGIVEAHGGRIWVESELGVGTTFHFTLKRAHAADAPSAEQRA